jgi:hypothetical protein
MNHPTSKLERAEQHLSEFNAACTEFVGQEPYTIRKQKKNERWQSVSLGPVPPHLALIFGDFVHTLRSALDHVVYELVSKNALDLPKKELAALRRSCSFPICRETADWDADPECFSGGIDKVRGLAPESVARIQDLQPFADPMYRDPQTHPLALLASLDNRDKHRKLIATVTDVLYVQAETSPGRTWLAPVKRTAKHLAEPRFVVPEVGMEAQATLAVLLTEAMPPPLDRALLWTPEMTWVVRQFIVTPGTMLPAWLITGVRETIQALEPFL